MKKIILSLVLLTIMFLIASTFVMANESDSYTLELEVLNNKMQKEVNIYILLPKEYILYAINHDNLNLTYKGPETLINNNIPSIKVEKSNIESSTYIDDEKEYV